MSHSPANQSETIDVSDPHKILVVNMTNVTKLTSTNFIMWSRQVYALFDGYDLAGYLDGSAVVPAPTITTEGDITPNPVFLLGKDKTGSSTRLSLALSRHQSSQSYLRLKLLQTSGTLCPQPTRNRVAPTSSSCAVNSKLGRKTQRPLMSTSKA